MAYRSLLLLLISFVGVSTALGQGTIEIQPFIGYTVGGTIPVNSNDLNIREIKFDGGSSYGATVGFNATEHLGFEFMWKRQSTEAVGKLSGGGDFEETIGVNLDQYHGNFILHFTDEDEAVRPFALIGLGATRGAGDGSSQTNFSFGVGGGLKYFFSQHIGLRLQARYAPTYLFSEAGGVWCNWWGVCWVVSNDKFLNQFDTSAGIIFRF